MDATLRGAEARAIETLPAGLGGLKVALVHDWLTGLRGGEKCLEVLCRAFPGASLHTLIHKTGSVGPIIGGMDIRPSPMQRWPGVFRHYRKLLPIMPMAARSWDVSNADLVVSLSHCVAKSVRVPEGVPPRLLLLHPDAVRLGRPLRLSRKLGRPPPEACPGRVDARRHEAVGPLVGRSRDVLRRHLSHHPRPHRPLLRQGFAGDRASGGHGVLHAIGRGSRRPLSVRVGAGAVQEDRPRDPGLLGGRSAVDRDRSGSGSRSAGGDGRTQRPVPRLAIGRGDPRPLPELSRLAVPRRGGLRDRPGRGDGLRRTRDRPESRRGGRGRWDDRSGVLYDDPTVEGLREALLGWESSGRPHEPEWSRTRAETYATPAFRDRLLGHLAEIVRDRAKPTTPPAPHLARRRRRIGS